jgi:hypothetical protein
MFPKIKEKRKRKTNAIYPPRWWLACSNHREAHRKFMVATTGRLRFMATTVGPLEVHGSHHGAIRGSWWLPQGPSKVHGNLHGAIGSLWRPSQSRQRFMAAIARATISS